MVNSPRPIGRRKGAPDTRGAILAAARSSFAERGMAGTSLRAVAARARVDPALALHFFGSKAGLFDAALEPPIDAAEMRALLDGPRSRIGERVVSFYVRRIFRQRGKPIASLVRSAVTDEAAAARLRHAIEHGPLAVVKGSSISGPLPVEMFASMMIGLFLTRSILRLEPLASMDDGELIARYAPIAQSILAPRRRR